MLKAQGKGMASSQLMMDELTTTIPILIDSQSIF
jgi:hypothetical protein